jgi:RNA polymerase sigma-70 factor (ECF subfamily)
MTKSTVITELELLELHSDYLFGFALSKLKNRDLALDFVNDTFLTFIEKQEQFEGRSSLRTYLTTILNRKIIDWWRSEKRKRSVSIDESNTNQSVASSSYSADFSMLREERHFGLIDCIKELPEKYREIIEAKYFEEMSSEEICKEFELTKSNFWVLVHRAKISLRNCLGEDF